MNEVAPDEAKTACNDYLVQDIISRGFFLSDLGFMLNWILGSTIALHWCSSDDKCGS
jgi:hypothetical protein